MRKLTIFLFAVVLVFAQIGMTKAEEIFFEGFEDSSGFTTAGCVPRGYWGIAPLEGTTTPALPSYFKNSQGDSIQDGYIFYGSYAKRSSSSPAALMTIVLPDLSGYTNLELTVALAASEHEDIHRGIFEPTHRDSLHIIGATTTSLPDLGPCTTGCIPPVTGVIDSFLPITYPDYLRSNVYPPVGIGHEFQDFTYPIDSSLKSLTFAFASTDYPEKVGIDSVRITGDLFVIPVEIDIKPGSEDNCVNINDHGVVPIAILGSADFDVTQVDPATCECAGMTVKMAGKSNKLLASIEDSNLDGFVDLVVKIEDSDAVLDPGAGTATLTCELYDGTSIQGTDDICIVP